MFRSRSIVAASILAMAPIGAAALPRAPTEETELRLDRLLEPAPPQGAQDGIAEGELTQSFDRLKEQILELVPGSTLETLARTLVDQQVELRLSSDRALVVFKLTLD